MIHMAWGHDVVHDEYFVCDEKHANNGVYDEKHAEKVSI